MSSFPSTISRRILLAPDPVARTAAAAVTGLQEQWMLCQPREVRRSYVLQVLDAGGGEREQRIWMLRQVDAVRVAWREGTRSRGGLL